MEIKIKKITYPTSLDSIEDIENDNIDIFVELENGMSLTLVVGTPKNLIWYMEKENINYCDGGYLDIIVSSLTQENIRQAVEYYAGGDGYNLKLIYLAGLNRGGFSEKDLNLKMKSILNEQKEMDEW